MTSLIKIWELPGGIHPPEHKAQSLQLPLGELPLPPVLVIPLNQHMGTPAQPVVQVGDRVLAGQLIGAADGIFSANTHASTSGIVIAIEARTVAHPSGMTSESVVIEPDGKHEWTALTPCENYRSLDRLDLLDKIRAAGVAGLGGAGFPTAIKLAPKSTQIIDTLVLNGAECEPYITADDMLMQVRAAELVSGTLLLSHILHQPDNLLIGIEDNKPKAIAAVKAAVAGAAANDPEAAKIRVVVFPTKYPSGGAKQLIQILTGREVPNGHHSADAGVICVNVGTAVAAWRAVRFGEPLISRVTTIVGEALTTQRNIDALFGTPISYVLKQHGFDISRASRVVMGGPMMGFTLLDLDAPVSKTTNCILAPGKQELPAPQPAQACIRCGLCSEVCPVHLLPQQLFWYAQAKDFDRLEAHNLFDCIECGACSYVCPSTIPLVQYYRAAKGSIRLHEIEKEKSDRSRQRFEFRQSRIAKEEAEKEAKRVARQKAAEEAKQKLAEKAASAAAAKTDGVTEMDSAAIDASTTDVISEVATKASAIPHATPVEQKAKLQRILAAAKNNLEFNQKPLIPNKTNPVISDEQLVKQQVRIKQAEMKVAEAEKKLADFIAEMGDLLPPVTVSPVAVQPAPAPVAVEQTAAQIAIARAKAKAAAKATISDEEKHAQQIQAIQSRLQKARERLEKAEAENDPNIDAVRLGVTKLEERLNEMS